MPRQNPKPQSRKNSSEKSRVPLEPVIPSKFKSIGKDEKKLCVFVQDIVDGDGPDMVGTVHDETKLAECIQLSVMNYLASALENNWDEEDATKKVNGDGRQIDLQFTFARLTDAEIKALPER